jgi:ribonuclease R
VPARSGDRVVLQPSEGREGHRGQLLGVLEGARTTRVGIVRVRGGTAVATPYRDEVDWRVPVARHELGGARDGDVVVLVPVRGEVFEPGRSARARVVEVLGPPGAPEADFRAVAWHRRLPREFPDAVLRAAAALPDEPGPDEIARRVDLRKSVFITIDPESARDHDDALCVEEDAGGRVRLQVAIADVSHFVSEDSPIDAEALRRGVSVYFPDRAIPMLPERISSDLCSLRPEEDRLAQVVEIDLDRRGRVQRHRFFSAVIRSCARLSYEEADRGMRARSAQPAGAAVARQLRVLGRLARTLRRRRAPGSIDFELPAAEIMLDATGRPTAIAPAARTLAHRAVEECMLAANRAVAEALVADGGPALYRNHEPPAPEDAEALQDLLQGFGLLDARRPAGLASADLSRALSRVRGRPEETLVNRVALRSMRQARYEVESRGHYALAFPHYTHFTSPIRRYADLVVHRVLKGQLGEVVSRPLHSDRAHAVASRVSWRERVAMQAERDMDRLKKCEFMASRVGEEFPGTVSGVARHGLYVTLDDWFVEGLVHVSTLSGSYRLDEKAFALVPRGSGPRYRLGDRLKVRVDSVDRIAAHVDFSPVGDRGPR